MPADVSVSKTSTLASQVNALPKGERLRRAVWKRLAGTVRHRACGWIVADISESGTGDSINRAGFVTK